jgi:hypothetical protein
LISLLVKISLALKPFHKLTYLLAFLISANVIYQLLFSTASIQANDKGTMLSLLALVWLALINLMLHLFTQIPEKVTNTQPFLIKIKNKLSQVFYTILSLVFIVLSIALIVLSFRMVSV